MAGMVRRRDCRYRRNPPPPYLVRKGPRVLDGNTSFPVREADLVRDEYGVLVDPRYGGIDSNEFRGRSGRER